MTSTKPVCKGCDGWGSTGYVNPEPCHDCGGSGTAPSRLPLGLLKVFEVKPKWGMLRLRGRIGWWLIRPFAQGAKSRFYWAHKNGQAGGDYGPHYWLLKYFGLDELERSVRAGRPLETGRR
jgi:hypothetical protein